MTAGTSQPIGRRPLLMPGGDPQRTASWLGLACALLVLASEFKLRTRDAGAALAAQADAQVLVELAVFAAVAGLLVVRRAAAASHLRPGARRTRTAVLGPGHALQVLRAIALLSLLTSFWSPTSIAPVRAVQLLVVVELAVEVVTSCRSSPRAASAFSARLRGVLALAVGAAAVLTFAVPGFQPFTQTYHGVSRFGLLEMHPLATGILLSVTALLVLRPALEAVSELGVDVLRDRAACVGLLVGAGLAAGVLLTRQRSVVLGFVVALLLLVHLVTSRRQREVLVLHALVLTAVVTTQLMEPVETYLRRGQSDDQLATLSGRIDIVREALRLFLESPVTGHGYLSGRSVFLPVIPWAGESHNLVIEVAVSGGLVGLVLFGFLLVRTLRSLRRGLRQADPARRSLAVDAAALLALLAVLSLTTDSVAGPPRLQVIALCVALAQLALATDRDPRTGSAARSVPHGRSRPLRQRPSLTEPRSSWPRVRH